MKSDAIKEHLGRLDQLVQSGSVAEAIAAAKVAFADVLKAVYAHIRGHASLAIMRRLLDLEIGIGGDDADFRTFDLDRLLALFQQDPVTEQLAALFAHGAGLPLAVDRAAVGRWLDSASPRGGPSIAAELQFVSAWLRMVALAAGLTTPAGDVAARRVVDPSSHRTGAPPLSEPARPQRLDEPVSGMTFVFIPGGTFQMGDIFDNGVDDEKPVHAVSLSSYYLAIHPVTQAQWKRLMPANPANFPGDDHPVEQVTLADVYRYIERLNASTPAHLQFDLPSEAQWEYAARSGGKAEAYAGGQDPETVAWFDANAAGGTAAVGRKHPNGLGIYDMSGNVWEWCRDNYHRDAYRYHAAVDPICTDGGADHVIRGGSWHLDAWSIRCSRRFRFDPELFGPALGFRVVMQITGSK